jgi:hypothetical protein
MGRPSFGSGYSAGFQGRSERYPAMDRVSRELRPIPGEEEGHEEIMAAIRKLSSLEALRGIGLP